MWNPFRKKSTAEQLPDSSFGKEIPSLTRELDNSRDEDSPTHSKYHVLLGQIADLHLRDDRPSHAKELYGELVEYYVDKGFMAKAVAILKKMHRIDPKDPDVLRRIADFNRKVPKYMVNTQMADELVEKSEELEKRRR